MTEQIEQNAYTQVLVRAATDEAFRAALLSDATGTLRSLGVEIPEGVAIKAVEDTDTVFHLIVPPKISEEMSDEELGAVNGGWFGRTLGAGIGAAFGGLLATGVIVGTGGTGARHVSGLVLGGEATGAKIGGSI